MCCFVLALGVTYTMCWIIFLHDEWVDHFFASCLVAPPVYCTFSNSLLVCVMSKSTCPHAWSGKWRIILLGSWGGGGGLWGG